MRTLVHPYRWHFTEAMPETFCPDGRMYIVDNDTKEVHYFAYLGTNLARVGLDSPTANLLQSLLGEPEPTYYQADINKDVPAYNIGGKL